MKSIPCPHCHKPISAADLRVMRATLNGQLGGRPKSDERCPCGLMTLARAQQRNHKCEPSALPDSVKPAARA